MEPDIVRNKRKIQILTPSGFVDFNGVSRKKVTSYYKVTFPNGEVLECTDNHRIKIKDEFIEAKDLSFEKELIQTETFVYDPINVGNDSEYLVGSIVNHNCVEFMGSSGTLIAGWKLKELVHQVPIMFRDGLSQYEAPIKDHIYAIVADVSRGKGLDYSAMQLIDVTSMPYKQVCVYRNNMITPIDYADVLYRIAKTYNNASILVEINDIGEQVGQSLRYDFDYEGVLMTENGGRAGKRITSGYGGSQADTGIRTTKPVKATGCSILKLLIEQNQLIINDFHSIEELSTFSRKNNSYEAEPGRHDDLVMGLVLFAWFSDQQYFKDYADINTLQKLREKTEEDIMEELLPFGFIDDGRDDTFGQLDLPNGANWMSDVESELL